MSGEWAIERARARKWAIAIVVAYLVVQLAGLKSVGLTDDDDFYIPAGISYAGWLGRALTFQDNAWSRQSIDAAFDPNHEHPPLAKYVFGISHNVFRFLGPTDGARVGTVLFSTLCAALMMLLALRHLGPKRGLITGGFGVAALLFMPRFYFHSHAATLDVPVAAMYLAATALALFGERSTRAALLAGPVFGLACATKLNAPFLLAGYAIFIVLTRRRRFFSDDERAANITGLRLPSIPLAFISMLIAGPIVFLAVWPWLWGDIIGRITGYVGFHLNHYGIYFLYFGEVFSKDPFAPWHAPFVMAATTIPLATTILALGGLRAAISPITVRLRFPDGPDDDRRREGDFLLTLILQALVAILAVAFSGGAKYGGEKLFMPFFPFWCLLAGYGALYLLEVLRSWKAAVGVCAAALISSLAMQLSFGEYALSEYNALTGGLRGATAIGFERQYYDVAFRDLVRKLSEEAPPNLRVHFLPNNWEYVRTYNWYRKSGDLRGDIQVVNTEAQADWIVITHERRFARYGDDLQRHRTKKIIAEKLVDGTPIWTIVNAKKGP